MSVATNLNDALKIFLLTGMTAKPTRQNKKEAKESSEWRFLLDSLLDLSYSQACESILQFVSQRYSVSSLAWLQRKETRLEAVCASGELHSRKKHLSISADDKRLLDAIKKEMSLELPNQQSPKKTGASPTIHLFPVAVGSEISSVLIVGNKISSEKTKRRIALFCRIIAPVLEILRLREELNRRGNVERIVQKFNESVKDIDKDIDTDDFWSSLLHTCADLLHVERSSLLVFDEKSNSLSAKAAIGVGANVIEKESKKIGARIAYKVLQNGKPLVVEDVRKTKIFATPAERNYQSNSFISYPIMIRERKIGVLNLTDRADGEKFSELDLEILQAIMPQLAVLTDSALLKHKAGKFQQLSVTDALTGLLNRLYLDERLPEEIRRSNREGFPMSFLMIDVDDFKSYNDNFGHTEGDKALKLLAHCLKDTLRGGDVAARYGGEEFSILLPQTTADGAATIAERIRERVATTEFPNRQITISVGVANCTNSECTVEKIIKWADDALYEAKRQGRNNVQVHKNLLPAQKCEFDRRGNFAKRTVRAFRR